MRTLLLLLSVLALSANAFGQEPQPAFHGMINADKSNSNIIEKLKSFSNVQDMVAGGTANFYRKFEDKIGIPGFISTSPINRIATVIGPDIYGTSVRIHDTIYLRWLGTPGPRVGDIYNIFKPKVTLQNVNNSTDFMIMETSEMDGLPKDYRLAGYMYESNGTIKITKAESGTVEAVVEEMTGAISLGDQLMPYLPPNPKIERLASPGFQLAAALVCGSPSDRLSTTKRSYIYLNRGTRDGVRVGKVFEAVENMPISDSVGGTAPETSVGEAVVVYATESFSTAMITEQFDVIRIGSLLKLKQNLDPIKPKFANDTPAPRKMLGDKSTPTDPSMLPVPPDEKSRIKEPEVPKEQEPMLSELDALEKSLKLNALSAPEKDRLNRLNKQASKDSEKDPTELTPEEMGESGDVPNLPTSENSFKKDANSAKKDTKKKPKKKKNEEEELNLLMMQN